MEELKTNDPPFSFLLMSVISSTSIRRAVKNADYMLRSS
jgi:hypothetical protein